MLVMLIFLAAGMTVGFLTRHRRRWIRWVQGFTLFFLYGFLGLLGMSVGMNERVMSNLASLGGQALLLSMAGILGSVFAAYGIERTSLRHLGKQRKEEP